ncbi:lipid A deacylase LpxR family protein [Shewanella woodyi]|uniref:lipid A deacylase LpxR family protein n=1 Tax=Shewanella woodyi TaxID=60961 RepID=UPI0007EA2336|nr:lipid A deacylase LpxR family protein [Shewanella woodyi]
MNICHLRSISLFSSLLLCSQVYGGQWHLQLDNDIIFGSDGNYTNGMILGWESAAQDRRSELPTPLQWQRLFLFNQQEGEIAWGAKFNQRMWTPEEIEIATPQPDDRPYAGLLTIETHTAHYGVNLSQKNWLSLGVMGPLSGAQQVQEFVHKFTDSSPPLGWQYQVENQVTIQLAYEVDALMLRRDAFNHALTGKTQWELSGFSHTQAGNFRTETELGVLFRWGNDLEHSFGRLSQHSGHLGNLTSAKGFSNFIFYSRAFVGYRFNDLSLEGSLPYDSRLMLEHLQYGVKSGIIWSHSNGSISWSFNSYSQEYQNDKQSWHGYGSLTFSWKL